MKIKHIPFWLLAVVLLIAGSVPVIGQGESETTLREIEKKVSSRLYALLELSQEWNENSSASKPLDRIRIISQSAVLINDPSNPVSLPDEMLQGQEFNILDYENRYYLVETQSGQQGWLSELYVERFTETASLKIQGFSLPSGSKKAAILSMATETYESLLAFYDNAERIVKDEELINSNTFIALKRKKGYADQVFTRNFEGFEVEMDSKQHVLQKLSLDGKVALGKSSFNRSFTSFGDETQKTGNTDLSLRLGYRLNNNSRVSLEGGTRKESLQSVYRNSFGGAGFHYSEKGRILNVGVKLNNYKDDFREINDYKRINLFADIKEQLSDRISLNFRYQLLNNSFSNRKANDYLRHALNFGADFKAGINSTLRFIANADLSSSETSFFDYNRYKPQLSFRTRSPLGRSRDITAYAEVFQFELVPLRSNNKYFFSIRGAKPGKKEKTTSTSELTVLARQFPNNSLTDFYQLNLGKGLRAYGNGNKQFNTRLITRYFPNNQDFSHADLHLDYQSNAKTYYSFTGNIRYWFPGERNYITTDLYAKVGAKIKTFSISPLLGIHNNLDLKADEFSLKGDKNSLRAGLEVKGELLLAKILRWNMRGAYEYGFVNNSSTESINNAGEIVFGDIIQRNPNSLQLQTDLSAKVMKQTELFASVRYFTYNTDLSTDITRTPVVGNDRFTAQIGVRFSYN